MIYRNVSDAKAELSKLIEEALAGKEVVLGKAGKPLIRFTLYTTTRKQRKAGRLKKTLRVPADFDSPDPVIAGLFGLDE
jgi:antitoxin (DNA-binding transcriptional repressor) of toxin-antitoxin stability system